MLDSGGVTGRARPDLYCARVDTPAVQAAAPRGIHKASLSPVPPKPEALCAENCLTTLPLPHIAATLTQFYRFVKWRAAPVSQILFETFSL